MVGHFFASEFEKLMITALIKTQENSVPLFKINK